MLVKSLFVLSLFCITNIFGNPLKDIETSFSVGVQHELQELLHHSTDSKSVNPSNRYVLKKGWNLFSSPQNGIDVVKSFQNISEVKFIVTYDFKSQYWAGFTLDQSVLKDIKEMLLLKYLEPHVKFFVLSSKNIMLSVQAPQVNKTCKKIMHTSGYSVLRASGLQKGMQISKEQDMALSSRYASHWKRGVYGDTRVILIYKKASKIKKLTHRYGPAEPTSYLRYSKEYANKKFFMYDFVEKKCYEGHFPSRKIPPVPVLKVISK